MIDLARFYLFVFGVLTIAGGVMGFVKAKSKPSLIAGSVSGAALIVAGYLVTTGTSTQIGLTLGLVVSLALAARFIGAYRKSKKVMPAGVMLLLGIVGVIVTALALIARNG
ncbi:MAG: TMEM14 family protein [Polyangiaceae bacterium]